MKNKKLRLNDYIFMSAGILLFLTLLSGWLLCGLFAKYTVKDSSDNSARVAQFGFVEVKEHKAELKTVADGQNVKDVYYDGKYDDMAYRLTDSEVSKNEYSIIMPGVDIPKDPFVRVTPSEVDCELYIEVTENNFPKPYKDRSGKTHDELVKYTIDSKNWNLVSKETEPDGDKISVYKYNDVIKAGFVSENGYRDIYILEGNKVYISQYYDAETYSLQNASFSLTFKARLVQMD